MRFPTILVSVNLLKNWINQSSSFSSIKWKEIFSHHHRMTLARLQLADPSLFPPILRACSSGDLLSFKNGKSVHACLIKVALDSIGPTGNSIIDFYVKSGDLASANGVFDGLRYRDSVSWNIMIYGHINNDILRNGLLWFSKARVAGFDPNISTLVLVIQECRSLGDCCHGLLVHGYIARSGFWDVPSVQNSMLRFYAEADMESARRLFDEMCDRDVISWSVMIWGYVQRGEPRLGLELFQEMVSNFEIKPDEVIVVTVLKACTTLKNMCMGRLVHGLVIHSGLDCDLFVENSLIDMYSKFNDPKMAFKVFNDMPGRNIVSWNSILSGFILNEKYSEALSLFYSVGKENLEADEITLVNILQVCKYYMHALFCKSVHCIMFRQGFESNELVQSSLIDAYAKCNLVELAWKLFNRMRKRDVVSWSTMIGGFANCGMLDEAIVAFKEMIQAKEKPNAITIINLLEACSVLAELKRCKWAHGIAIRRGLATEVAVGTAMVDMYSKCGSIEASRNVFDHIPYKNVLTWSAMIGAYGMNGLGLEALTLLDEMKLHGLEPNPVTALAVLSACSHGGLVEEGLSFFNSMVQNHGFEPELEHYSCIIDMLARAGKLESAMELIKKMPEGLKTSASAWGTLLSACRSYGDGRLAERAVSRLLELEPLNPAGYLLASSMYAAAGSWAEAARMRRLVKERGLRIVAGYSLIHVDKKVCRFVAGDESNPSTGMINSAVKNLHTCMKTDEGNDFGICE